MQPRMLYSLVTGMLLLPCAALAQSSASFGLAEHTFNAGGHPADGIVMFSPSYRITLDSIGDSMAGRLSSASYAMDSGFVPAYPAPLEVQGLGFTNVQTLVWIPTPSATGGYNLYRDLLSTLQGLSYGSCAQQNLPQATTTDTTPVPANNGYFFLVTGENTLNEEGSKGSDSAGTERLGTICP